MRLTQETLRRELSVVLSIADIVWALVFCDYDDTAVVIFSNTTDAEKVLRKRECAEFKLSKCDDKVCGKYEHSLDSSSFRELQQRNMVQEFNEVMKDHDIQIKTNDPLTFEFPTRYQFRFFKQTLGHFTKTVRSSASVTNVQNVSKLQYDSLTNWKCSQKLPFKDIYDERLELLIVEFSNKEEHSDFEKARSFLDEIRKKEIYEIPFSKYYYDDKLVLDFSREIGQHTCFFIRNELDKLRLLCVCNTYEEYMSIKHKFELRSGMRKQTNRLKRKLIYRLCKKKMRNVFNITFNKIQ